MRDAGNIKAKFLLEGVDIPLISVSRSRGEGVFSGVDIGVFYSKTLRDIAINSSVMVFIYSDRVGKWELFFDGRFKGVSLTESSNGRSQSIKAMGRFQILQELPLMIYNMGSGDDNFSAQSSRMFYGLDPKEPFALDITTKLYQEAKKDVGTALANTIKRYIEHSQGLSRLYEREVNLTRLSKIFSIISNSRIATFLSTAVLNSIGESVANLNAGSTMWNVMGYLMGFGQMNFIESIDGVDPDGNRIDAMVKPILHFMRPPLCNTILMKEESNATLSFSDSPAEAETRVAIANSTFNKTRNNAASTTAFAPKEVHDIMAALTTKADGLNNIASEQSVFDHIHTPLGEIYTDRELLQGAMVGSVSRSPLEGIKQDLQKNWLDTVSSYQFSLSRFSRRYVTISGLTLNRNIVPGFPATIITRSGEMILGLVYNISDSIDFPGGTAISNVTISNPIYLDEFGTVEGFSMENVESSLAYFDDKFKPENINAGVYAHYGMQGDESSKNYGNLNRMKTMKDFFGQIMSTYQHCNSYKDYAAVFTRNVFSLEDAENKMFGGAKIERIPVIHPEGWTSSALSFMGYRATKSIQDNIDESYTGVPFLIERQQLAGLYAMDVIGKKIGEFEIATYKE